jgi:hypothetical protein
MFILCIVGWIYIYTYIKYIYIYNNIIDIICVLAGVSLVHPRSSPSVGDLGSCKTCFWSESCFTLHVQRDTAVWGHIYREYEDTYKESLQATCCGSTGWFFFLYNWVLDVSCFLAKTSFAPPQRAGLGSTKTCSFYFILFFFEKSERWRQHHTCSLAVENRVFSDDCAGTCAHRIIYIYLYNIYIYMYVHTCIHTYTYTYIYIYLNIRMCIRIFVYT